jgi:ATP-binding cassette subfamily B protein
MLKLMAHLKKRDWLMMTAVLCFVLLQVWLELTMPDYMKDITSLVQTPGSVMRDILIAGSQMLLCALGAACATVATGFFAARIAANFSYEVRQAVFGKVNGFGAGEIGIFQTPSLITRTTNDITQTQMVIALGLQVLLQAPILAVWAVIKIVGKSWQLSMVTAGAVVILLTTIALLLAAILPKFRKVQWQIDDMNRITRENLSGIRVVRAFNAEGYQEEKFETANYALLRTQLFTQRAMAVAMPMMMMVMSGLSLAIYWYGGWLLNRATLADRINQFSNLIVFGSYATYVVMAFVMIAAILILIPRAQISAKRILAVLETDITVKEGRVTKGKSVGEVEFQNVSFRYPGKSEDELHDISFHVKKGETIAFIGATGSGKSTVVNLAGRFYDVTGGAVLVDGVNVKDYAFHALYDKIGYISQKSILFSDSVKGNITFGESASPITDSAIQKAVEISQSAEFVEGMPDGLDSNIAQSGSNISGGQKQRLSIARAIARKPEILIFDDSFSALDYKTDKILRQKIASDLPDTTCLIVAQRIGTIKNADQIVVLDDGEAAGIGTHDELMKNCSVYREIALSQLSSAELGE